MKYVENLYWSLFDGKGLSLNSMQVPRSCIGIRAASAERRLDLYHRKCDATGESQDTRIPRGKVHASVSVWESGDFSTLQL